MNQFLDVFSLALTQTARRASPTQRTTSNWFLSSLSVNQCIIIMVVAAVILYIIIRQLYMVLIDREFHPAGAKVLVFSIFFGFLCAIFTVLFLYRLATLIFIGIWVVLAIAIILAVLKRRK